MSLQFLKNGLAVTALVVLASCASKPPSFIPLSSTADPSGEIAKTEELITAARDRQLDVLSPKNFSRAEDALADAKNLRSKDKPNEKVLKEVAYARGWLQQAEEKGEVARTSMKDITDARANAWRAGADKNYPKDWKKLENDTMDVTEAIERGNLGPADRNTGKLVDRYRELEVRSVSANALGKADANIKAAIKNDAEKLAPKSLAFAQQKYAATENLIKQNPKNSVMINRMAEDATRASAHLVTVTDKVKASGKAGMEDLVLRDERQQRMITGLRTEAIDSTVQADQLAREKDAAVRRERELQQKQALIDKANKVRSQFNPNEAEVYTQGNKVMIRLKGMEFASNQSRITPRGEKLLQKVESAVNEFQDSKVIVEGHTDTVGSRQANMVVSEKRAKAVEKYLVTNGVDADRIEAVGMGYQNPVSDNKTPQGRAQNRRIDVIIEAQ
ncbi:Peptidoglycan-binding protein ArfA [compost metagenome]